MLNSLRSKKRNGRGRRAGAWLLPTRRWWPQSQQPPVLDPVSQPLNCFLQIKKTKHNSRLCSWQFLWPTSSPTQNTFLLPGLPGSQGAGRGAAGFHPTCRKQPLLEVLLFSSEISIPTENPKQYAQPYAQLKCDSSLINSGSAEETKHAEAHQVFLQQWWLSPSWDAGAQLRAGRGTWTSVCNIWVSNFCC